MADYAYINGDRNRKVYASEFFDGMLQRNEALKCPGCSTTTGAKCNGTMFVCRKQSTEVDPKTGKFKFTYYFASNNHVDNCSEAHRGRTLINRVYDDRRVSIFDIINDRTPFASEKTDKEKGGHIGGEGSDEAESLKTDIENVICPPKNVFDCYCALHQKDLEDTFGREQLYVGDLVIDERTIEEYSNIGADMDGVKFFLFRSVYPPVDIKNLLKKKELDKGKRLFRLAHWKGKNIYILIEFLRKEDREKVFESLKKNKELREQALGKSRTVYFALCSEISRVHDTGEFIVYSCKISGKKQIYKVPQNAVAELFGL